MEIYICSHERATKQITYQSLPPSIRTKTRIVIQPSQLAAYTEALPDAKFCLLVPSVTNIAQTRDFLKNMAGQDKFVMLDDDLVFAKRRGDDPTKFLDAEPVEIEDLFEDIEHTLDEYAHVGVSGREGANRRTENKLTVTRMMRILAYRRDVLQAEGIDYDSPEGELEDFDVTLQLLRLGYPNCVINWMVNNQSGSNTDGGCSTYRTPDSHTRACERLAEKHHPFVKVVQKETKQAWGGGTRTDVRIQWKKAYESAERVRVLGEHAGGDAGS